MEFSYDGGGLAKGGTVRLFVDGTSVGEGRVEATIPLVSPLTRRPTSAGTQPRPSARTIAATAAFSPAESTGYR